MSASSPLPLPRRLEAVMLAAEHVLTLDEIAEKVTSDGRGLRVSPRQVELELRGDLTRYKRVEGFYLHRGHHVPAPRKAVPIPVKQPAETSDARRHPPQASSASASAARDLEAVWRVRDPRLWAWQTKALAAWEANASRGVVTAVTGAGKTNVGIAAIARSLREGGQAAVVVPTLELVEQWTERLVEWAGIHRERIGRLDGTTKDALLGKDVLVCVVNTAARVLPRLANDAIRPVLLVADECHRYGAETFAAALDGPYKSTLGLSATPERSGDAGMETNVFPRLGPPVFQYGYEAALADEVISEFAVTFVALKFSPRDRAQYDLLTEKISTKLFEVMMSYPQLEDSPYLFLDLQRLLEETRDTRLGELFRMVTRRQQILQRAPARAQYVEWLAKKGLPGEKGILFHSRIEECESLAQILVAAGIAAAVHHSELSRDERRRVLFRFQSGTIRVLCSPRTLEEGVDVPDADFAVLVAGTTVTRQRVQRLGRVLRKTKDKKTARGYVLYVEDTVEDPRRRHDRFVQDLEKLCRLKWTTWPTRAQAPRT